MNTHIYWMAPSVPSRSQRRASTMCKQYTPPGSVAAPGRVADCPVCIEVAKGFVRHHRDALSKLNDNDPNYTRVTSQLAKLLQLLPLSEQGE